MVGPVEDPFAGLPPGHVREPGHHDGLQGVQSDMVDSVDDPFPSAIT